MLIFRIGPHRYELRFVAGDITMAGGERALGYCDSVHRRIWIARNQPQQQLLTTILHEIRHAWRAEMGDPADPESDAQAFAACVTGIMEDLCSADLVADVRRRLQDLAGQQAARPISVAQDGDTYTTPVTPTPTPRPPARAKPCPPPAFGAGIDVDAWRQRLQAAGHTRCVEDLGDGRRRAPAATLDDQTAALPSTGLGARCCPSCGRLVSYGQIYNGPVTPGPLGPQMIRTLFCDFCHHLVRWPESATCDGRPADVTLTPFPEIITGPEVDLWLAEHPEATGTVA